MRKDAVYRMRVPKRILDAIKRVAAAKGEDASEWVNDRRNSAEPGEGMEDASSGTRPDCESLRVPASLD